MNEIAVAIIGATGFGGAEILRLALFHPMMKIVSVVSSSASEQRIDSVHPHLKKLYNLNFESKINSELFNQYSKQVIFLALPHGQSEKHIKNLSREFPSAVIIDLSGDLRLKDPKLHLEFYPLTDLSLDLREKAVYGLPEYNSENIKNSKLVSNPGCLATASILALLPLCQNHLKSQVKNINLNLATGSSGSGKEPKITTHHPIRHSNFLAYKPLEHQHTPEILQALSNNGLNLETISFVPHSLPVSRGILCTAFISTKSEISKDKITREYFNYYNSAYFVRIIEDASSELQNVIGTNFCDISIAAKGSNIIINAAIDNLVKGMAGQAIHNMNICFGLSEHLGLKQASLRPI